LQNLRFTAAGNRGFCGKFTAGEQQNLQVQQAAAGQRPPPERKYGHKLRELTRIIEEEAKPLMPLSK
jgi:hypothetical protein